MAARVHGPQWENLEVIQPLFNTPSLFSNVQRGALPAEDHTAVETFGPGEGRHTHR